LAHALQAMHNMSIFHRDIKAENVLVKENPYDKSKYFLVFTDFGVAKECYDVSLNIHSIVGTAKTGSPEQFGKSKYSLSNSDVYSMGSLLYFMLEKQYPYSTIESDNDELHK